jgi:hypothetical protein
VPCGVDVIQDGGMEKKKHELFFEIGTEYEMRVVLGMGEGRGLTFYSNRVDVWGRVNGSS